jgi:hypothetical protein
MDAAKVGGAGRGGTPGDLAHQFFEGFSLASEAGDYVGEIKHVSPQPFPSSPTGRNLYSAAQAGPVTTTIADALNGSRRLFLRRTGMCAARASTETGASIPSKA